MGVPSGSLVQSAALTLAMSAGAVAAADTVGYLEVSNRLMNNSQTSILHLINELDEYAPGVSDGIDANDLTLSTNFPLGVPGADSNVVVRSSVMISRPDGSVMPFDLTCFMMRVLLRIQMAICNSLFGCNGRSWADGLVFGDRD